MADFSRSKRKQTSWSGQQLTSAIQALDALGPQRPLPLETADKPVCHCLCKKPLYVANIVPKWTGQVHALNNVCKDCEKESNKMAALVCVACKQVAGRLAPHRDQMGFVFEAGKFYHIDRCGTCAESGGKDFKSVIIEQFLYHQKMGRRN